MNFKIIETKDNLPNVLIYRDETEEGEICVVIHCIGEYDNQEDGEDIISEVIQFDNKRSAINFIRDYSEESANLWCEEKNILTST